MLGILITVYLYVHMNNIKEKWLKAIYYIMNKKKIKREKREKIEKRIKTLNFDLFMVCLHCCSM